MGIVLDGIELWFKDQPKWLQEAMRQICEKGDACVADIYELFKSEIVEGKDVEIEDFKHGWLRSADNYVNVHLLKIYILGQMSKTTSAFHLQNNLIPKTKSAEFLK